MVIGVVALNRSAEEVWDALVAGRHPDAQNKHALYMRDLVAGQETHRRASLRDWFRSAQCRAVLEKLKAEGAQAP